MSTNRITCLLIGLALLSLPTSALADPPDYAEERAIVAPRSGEHGRTREAIAAHGGRVIEYYAPGDFFIVETPGRAPEWVASMRQDAAVRYAEVDELLSIETTTPTETTLSNGTLWGLNKIAAPSAWDYDTGSSSVVVGVIDTGIDYTHPDLAGNIWLNTDEIPGNGLDDDFNGYIDDVHGWDWVNNDSAPLDDHSHGTHVAGTIGATANDGGVVGVSWDVSMMALKFLNASGSGSTSNAVKAIDYATNNGARITNNSWGGGSYNQALVDAIARAQTGGSLFVAAAGNSSKNTDSTPHYPSSYSNPNIISVASTTDTDALSSFSNYGINTVDLAAPGSSIYSTLPNRSYGYKSGTSMASPHVAGAAALLWAEHPGDSWSQMRDRILGGVDVLSSLSGKVATGGRLNLYGSVDAAPAITNLFPSDSARVTGIVAVSAGASDDYGVASVEFVLDGAPLGTDVDGSDGWGVSWDTTAFAEGSHSLQAAASDTAGQTGSKTTTVIVDNQPDPPQPVLHVHDLSGTATSLGGGRWKATVTIEVHDQNATPAAGATVTFSWSSGGGGTCVLDSTGKCMVSTTSKRTVTSVTLTVTGVSLSGAVYDPAQNHDPAPAGSVTVARP